MFQLTRRQFLYDNEGGGSGGGGGGGSANSQSAGGNGAGAGGTTPPAESFETWLGKQDKGIQDLYSAHTNGLRSALSKERDARSDAERQLRELAKKADAGSDLQNKLTQQADQMAELARKSTFYDKAHAAGVKNLNLAYLAAREAKLIDDKGEVDIKKLQEQFPELFGGSPPPPGNAGSGTNSSNSGKVSMDDLIRRRAGIIQ